MKAVHSAQHYQPSSLVLGLGLIIIGCFSSAIGLGLMKRSTDVEMELPLHKRYRWMLGFLFLVVNATVLDLIAFGLIPLALISPFSGLTMVFSLCLAASGLLHSPERISYEQAKGCGLVLLGLTVASVCGPHASARGAETMPVLLEHFSAPAFINYMVISVSMVAAYLWVLLVPSAAKYRPDSKSWMTTVGSAYTASVCGALSQLFMKVVSIALHEAAAGGGTGQYAGYGLLLHPAVAISLVGLVLAAPLQLFLINNTLASSPVSYAVPVYQALLTLLTTAAGGIFFREFAKTTMMTNLLCARRLAPPAPSSRPRLLPDGV